MRLHNIQALVFLAFQFTIASTAPTNSAIEAKSDLIARNVNCAAGCWSDGYGEVPVGSFSFIMDHRHGCTMTLKTQGNPQQGIVYKLNANGTIACGKSDLSPPFPERTVAHLSLWSLVLIGKRADDELPIQTRPSLLSSQSL